MVKPVQILNKSFTSFHLSIVSSLIALAAVVQYFMGREWWGRASGWRIMTVLADSTNTSQLLADPYTFSHIIHGFVFFYFFRWLGKKLHKDWSLGVLAILATAVEVAWEIWENTPFIINRYRSETVSLNYYGDSVINSACDTIFMLVGFYLATKLNWKYILLLTLIMELGTLLWVRDNLTLNIVMLVYPLQAIKNWQGGR